MDPKALRKISYGLYVLGTRLDGKDAGCIADAFIQSASAPVPTVILCSMLENQTNAAVRQTGACTLSVWGTDVDPFAASDRRKKAGGRPAQIAGGARFFCPTSAFWHQKRDKNAFFFQIFLK